jgi:uncharacterized tellurite resistance protein B-like protein
MKNNSINVELKSHFLRLYQIALADENFSHLELHMLYKFAEERAVSKSDLDDILTHFTGDVIIPETLEKKIEYLYDFAKMIWADEIITDEERSLFKKYIKKFGFQESYIDELCDYLLDSAVQGKSKENILNELK